jgi:two-component system chemotaxis sensor kinase CheA
MSFDLSQFNQLFFEETAEHLATMESLMLNMDVQAPDMDDLNAVFRAAHSIKGNSGTFGFHDMTDVTHELETLLDLVRKGEADLTDEMVDVTLQAGDVLKGLLESHQEGGEADLEPSKAVIAELDVQLAKAKGEVSPKSSVVNESSSGVIAASEQIDASLSHTAEAYETNVNQSFIIRFPDPGDDTSMLFDSLKELGELSIIDSPESGGDDWLFSLQTESQKKDIRELVEFLVPPEGISIDEELNADDGSFGFFEDVSNISEPSDNDLGYGFFDDIDLKGDASEDPGYGFFDSQDEAVTEESVVADEDLGYGFFEDLDSQAPSDEITGVIDAEVIANSSDNALDKINTSNTEKDKGEGEAQAEFDGYGFFEPIVDKSSDVEKKPEKKNDVTASPKPKSLAKKSSPPPAKAAAVESSIRVSVEKVDQLINQVGELVITQAMLTQMASEVDPILHEKMANGLAQLERNTRDLQDSVMSIRMMPISLVFSRFPRVVRDLAGKLNKKVKLEMVGENTELDRSMIEKLTDPLTHLIRNSLDHGIEMPETRIAADKDPTGTILLRASHQGGNIVVEVQDDGGGLNRDNILSKAIEKGLPVSDSMPDSDVWQLIFAPGFSTAAEVTDVSGRGVGMDVVKRNITSLGGRLEIESIEGIGTRISIRLPLTLAILDGMQVSLGDEIYIIPLTSIIGSMQTEISDIKSVSGEGAVIAIRDEYLPILRLSDLMNMPGEFTDFEQGIMIILETDGKRVALFVDDIVGQSQVVIKSLEANYRKVDGVSGATILGTGRVALILDVAEIIDMHKHRVKKHLNSALA